MAIQVLSDPALMYALRYIKRFECMDLLSKTQLIEFGQLLDRTSDELLGLARDDTKRRERLVGLSRVFSTTSGIAFRVAAEGVEWSWDGLTNFRAWLRLIDREMWSINGPIRQDSVVAEATSSGAVTGPVRGRRGISLAAIWIAVRILPSQYRERYYEEFLSELFDHSSAWARIGYGFRLVRRASVLRRSLWEGEQMLFVAAEGKGEKR
jgi:hypothetical protein